MCTVCVWMCECVCAHAYVLISTVCMCEWRRERHSFGKLILFMYDVASSFPETSFILFVCSFCPFTLLSACFLHSSLPLLPSLYSPLVAFILFSRFLHPLLFSPLVAFILLSPCCLHSSLPLFPPSFISFSHPLKC